MITKEQMIKIYPNTAWVEFYFALRLLESRTQVTPTMMKNYQAKITHILFSLPPDATEVERERAMEQALAVINDETKGVFKEKLSLTSSDLYDIV